MPPPTNTHMAWAKKNSRNNQNTVPRYPVVPLVPGVAVYRLGFTPIYVPHSQSDIVSWAAAPDGQNVAAYRSPLTALSGERWCLTYQEVHNLILNLAQKFTSAIERHIPLRIPAI